MLEILAKARLKERCQRALAYPPTRYGLGLGVALIATGLLMGLAAPVKNTSAEPSTLVMSLAVPTNIESSVANDLAADSAAIPDMPPETGVVADEDMSDWAAVTVKSGQTLDRIFRDQGYSAQLLHDIIGLNEQTKGLARIRPGQTFFFRNDEADEFSAMRLELNETQTLVVSRLDGNLRVDEELKQIERRVARASGSITDSLYLSGQRSGMSDRLIMQLAAIFGWDIDFVLDIRQGDQFHVIFEQLYRDGEYLRDGQILAATFVNQSERFQAVGRMEDSRMEYYTPEGRNMRKAFLRAPLNFSYVSSSFNPRRFHPILKRVKPHNGIDYRAPTGTPVYAAGDGKVIRSAYSQYNGHHVFIQHGDNIVTKYLHFNKRTVKSGQRVKQGQTIGTVGSTGMSQAPHLHYEFVVNGVHRNPRTVSLPKAEPLPGTELDTFLASADPYLQQLKVMEDQLLLASRD